MNRLVTGFSAFGSITDNPSAHLAEHYGGPFRVLEVSYAAVDRLIDELVDSDWDQVIFLGVAAQATTMRLELNGRNRVGITPDVAGVVAGPGVIDPSGPPKLDSDLWKSGFEELTAKEPSITFSTDAGDYLCNYTLYQARLRLPNIKTGFLHVPTADTCPLGEQMRLLHLILDVLDVTSTPRT